MRRYRTNSHFVRINEEYDKAIDTGDGSDNYHGDNDGQFAMVAMKVTEETTVMMVVILVVTEILLL